MDRSLQFRVNDLALALFYAAGWYAALESTQISWQPTEKGEGVQV